MQQAEHARFICDDEIVVTMMNSIPRSTPSSIVKQR